MVLALLASTARLVLQLLVVSVVLIAAVVGVAIGLMSDSDRPLDEESHGPVRSERSSEAA